MQQQLGRPQRGQLGCRLALIDHKKVAVVVVANLHDISSGVRRPRNSTRRADSDRCDLPFWAGNKMAQNGPEMA